MGQLLSFPTVASKGSMGTFPDDEYCPLYLTVHSNLFHFFPNRQTHGLILVHTMLVSQHFPSRTQTVTGTCVRWGTDVRTGGVGTVCSKMPVSITMWMSTHPLLRVRLKFSVYFSIQSCPCSFPDSFLSSVLMQ